MKKWICALLAFLLVLGTVPMFAQPVSAATVRSVSDSLISVLKTMEGFRAKPYWDTNHWAIGYGTACPSDKLDTYNQTGITVAEAEQLLHNELTEFESDVNSFAANRGLTFSQHQFDALVSFSYNCGSGWMYETDGYFYNAVCKGYTGSKFIYAIGLYSSAGGTYALMQRRLCEANMYLNGVYKAYNSGSNAYPSTYKWAFLDANGGGVRYRIYAYDAADKLPIDIAFTDIPTGVGSDGKPFAYAFAGWYTAEGTQVTVLDTSVKNEVTLYAKWKDPSGNIVEIPRGETVDMKVTVTEDVVNVRSGPSTSYEKVTTVKQGDQLSITQLYTENGYTWGKFDKGWLRLDFTNYDEVKPSEFPKMGTVNGSDVNYRTQPEVSAATLVGQKQKGDRVTITEEWYSGTMWWGKMSDGYWISLNYVTYDEDVAPVVTGIQMWRNPDKIVYLQGTESLQVDGGVILVTYDNGETSAVSLTEDMVSGFSNAVLGTVNVKVTYGGKTTTFPVTIQGHPGTVTFKNYDGTVLSSKIYNYGDTVTPPEAPTREPENGVTYEFVGWDKEVTVFQGDVVYTAVFRQVTVKGDITQDGNINNDDVVELLWHTLFPEEYPLKVSGDIVADGNVNNEDVVYLLWHTLFPSEYPL